VDDAAVQPHQPVQSISAEDTFGQDVTLAQMEPRIRALAAKVWQARLRERREPRTVVLKLKTRDFRVLTRSLTPPAFPASADELAVLALALRDRVQRPASSLYRLVGVGIANCREPDGPPPQPRLFA
jgi:DNA polymerase IV